MATLLLKEFRCLEESDEVDDDSPYFLVFEGNPARPASEADLAVVRREAWDNTISSGDFRSVNQVITKDVGTNHLVLCALMEEDNDRDIAGDAFRQVRDWMRTMFDAFRASGSASANSLATNLKPEFRRALNNARTNDEIIDIVHVPVTTTDGLLPLRYLYGDGGRYKVRFETQS